MAEYAWEARSRTGELRKGLMDADSPENVEQRLRQQQLTPVAVKRAPRQISIQFGSGVKTKDLVTFSRLFATMIDAGLPIVQCLEILSTQQPNKIFGNVLRDVKTSVEQGASFSDSLRRHPRVFDELFVNLVEAGELERLPRETPEAATTSARRHDLSFDRHRDSGRCYDGLADFRHSVL
jgi:type IV pilus assembly protein PilC